MKKIIVLLMLFCVAVFAQSGKTKIAVYVTGGKIVGENKALGTKMLAALLNSGRYETIERSEGFLAEIAKEQKKQRNGSVDDSQISELGKQFGVQFVCIADITSAFGSYQISARIINVETAVVVAIGEADSPLESMEDLTIVSNKVVEAMLGIQVTKPVAAAPAPAATAQETVSNYLVDSRDNRRYGTVKIGAQIWMAENLNYNANGSKCYNNDQAFCNALGRLYNWTTAKNACPSGWHLPSDNEWAKLVDFAGGISTAGNKLKARNGWNSNGNGTDNYGFSALPGGDGGSGGNFGNAGNYGRWWSATEKSSDYAYYHNIIYYSENINKYDYAKYNLLSVRCIKD